jgi:hypothetical protein
MAKHVELAPRTDVIRVALSGIAGGVEFDDIAAELSFMHPPNNTYPGEVLLDLAADAIEESGATRDAPLNTDDIVRRLLPEDRAHNRVQRYKINFTIRAAAMIRGGVDPALLENAAWSMDDLWFWSFEALVIYVRAAAERADVPVAEICGRIAKRHDVSLNPKDS